ncbi:MAG: hypothetical protein ACAH83_15270 [Alphaproteobacteria bacterium]
MKFSIKEVFQKIGRAIAGPEPVNSMMSGDVAYIQTKVREATGFDVGCQDTRLVNGRKNAGLIMPENTPADQVTKAEDVFIAAAKERNIELTREQVIHYVPGTISPPSRFVQPAPKTW